MRSFRPESNIWCPCLRRETGNHLPRKVFISNAIYDLGAACMHLLTGLVKTPSSPIQLCYVTSACGSKAGTHSRPHPTPPTCAASRHRRAQKLKSICIKRPRPAMAGGLRALQKGLAVKILDSVSSILGDVNTKQTLDVS